MERQYRSRTVIIGAGNVATHLARRLDATTDVVAVWSRKLDHAEALSSTLRNARATDNVDEVPRDADFYIISVVDDHIADVARRLGVVDGIVAHTSGSFPLEGLRQACGATRCGVFYPLQTFSKTTEVDTDHIPFFIEGTDAATIDALAGLATSVSDNVHRVDSSVRGHLHIAAVFANNFANYMWDIADSYLKEHTDFDIRVFAPLLTETLRKAMAVGPRAAQTGPAKRGDREIIDKHIAALADGDAEIYRLISNSIIEKHKTNE